jgi:membrane peptidoglycan carboxypeptidase
VGSSYKVFTYTAAIATRQVTMETQIVDGPNPLKVPQPGHKDYEVFNYDRGLHGTLPLREAFSNSLNIPAVKTELAIGVPTLVDFSRNIGVYPRADDNPQANMSSYGPSLTLGGYPITILEEASGIATIANLGVYHQPTSILTVKDAKGRLLYQTDPAASRRQAIDPGVAFITSTILSDDRNRARIFGLNGPLHLAERHSAAKTGTADDFKDTVALGWTPDLAAVIWVGDILDLSHHMVPHSDSSAVTAPPWHRFMYEALNGIPDKWYEAPSNVVRGDRDGTWFLSDQRNVPTLPNDHPLQPSPTPSADPNPPDPGTGPVPVPSPSPSPRPHPSPSVSPCPSPTSGKNDC